MVSSKNFINLFKVVQLDNNSCLQFGRLKSELKKSGLLVPDADLLIGSIALGNNLTLVSNNTQHFQRMTQYGLKLESNVNH